MRLIDVLNKIANGELKEGTRIKHCKNIYVWEKVLGIKNFCRETEEDIFLDALQCLEDEVELIEPDHFADVGEMAECKHEWAEYTGYNAKTGETKHYMECIECGLQEEIEDNIAEKIEELNIDFANEIITCNHFQILATNKLNEVIRKINKEGNNE